MLDIREKDRGGRVDIRGQRGQEEDSISFRACTAECRHTYMNYILGVYLYSICLRGARILQSAELRVLYS